MGKYILAGRKGEGEMSWLVKAALFAVGVIIFVILILAFTGFGQELLSGFRLNFIR